MARIRVARDVGEFMRRPLGAGVLVETNFIWCASPSLGGSVGWGSPTGKQAERVMGVCAAMFHDTLGPQMDVILDGYRLDQVSPAVAMAIFDWVRRNLDALKKRIRRQLGVPPPGVGGLLLSGMRPIGSCAAPTATHCATRSRSTSIASTRCHRFSASFAACCARTMAS
jgi:hypothetical protein